MFVCVLAACLLFASACAGNMLDSDHDASIDEAIMRTLRNGLNSRRMGNTVIDGLDMRLTQSQYEALYGNATGRSTRRTYTPWTNGVIPFEIQRSDFTDAQIKKIEQGMANWERMTCIRFKRATSGDAHRIVIKSLEGCWSYLGMLSNSRQDLSLQASGCFWRGTVEHELGHAIGMVHEHQRPNRDANIRVNMNNVEASFKDQLTMYTSNDVHKYRLPYDYTSVMHYGQYAFSVQNGQKRTITAIRDDAQESVTHALGKALWASFYDVQLVNTMYNCNARCSYKPTCRAGCFVDQHCKCFCKSDMPPVPCLDAASDCGSIPDGHCWQYQSHYEIYCRKRCGMCAVSGTTVAPSKPVLPNCRYWNSRDGCTSGITCKDYNENCSYWATHGECQKNPGYMSQNCKRSCGWC